MLLAKASHGTRTAQLPLGLSVQSLGHCTQQWQKHSVGAVPAQRSVVAALAQHVSDFMSGAQAQVFFSNSSTAFIHFQI